MPKKLLLDSAQATFKPSATELQQLQELNARELDNLLENFYDGFYNGLSLKQMLQELKAQ